MTIPEVRYDQVAGYVEDKAIAVVANSPVLLEHPTGEHIDRHDIVLRMNAAIPQPHHAEHAGTRTDILAVGTLMLFEEAVRLGARPQQVWWMKLTETGQDELRRLQERASHYRFPFNLWVWPEDMEARVRERVGAPPSTGIRVLDYLQHYCNPRAISVFGMTFFGATDDSRSTSWYRPGRAMKAPHDGQRELAAFNRMGLSRRGPGWWSKVNQKPLARDL